MSPKALRLDADNIGRLYKSGLSENAVAKHFGVSRSVIRRYLIATGIHIRNQSAAEALKWSLMTPEKRANQVAAAHIAAKGRKPTEEELTRRVLTRKRPIRSSYEISLSNMLGQLGLPIIPQLPCGPYQIDIAITPIAVEVFGGNWHTSGHHTIRANKRAHYLFDAGWHILVIWVDKRRHPISIDAAHYIKSWLNDLRRQPSVQGQYRVIWGDGQFISAGSANEEHITFIPPFRASRNPATGRYVSIPR